MKEAVTEEKRESMLYSLFVLRSYMYMYVTLFCTIYNVMYM